jgi:hypothetical protein
VISFIRQLFIYVSDVSDDPRWNFRLLSTAPITAPSFDETAGICAIVAVVDTRSLVGARNHYKGSVPETMLCTLVIMMKKIRRPLSYTGENQVTHFRMTEYVRGLECRDDPIPIAGCLRLRHALVSFIKCLIFSMITSRIHPKNRK